MCSPTVCLSPKVYIFKMYILILIKFGLLFILRIKSPHVKLISLTHFIICSLFSRP